MTWQLDVALVQAAATLDPATNRAIVEDRTPDGADLVLFPEAMARDFGKSGSVLTEFAEPVDGPFGLTLVRAAKAHDTTIVAGMFEASDTPERPFNTLIVAGDGAIKARYRKIHLYDSFGYRESDMLTAGPRTPTVIEVKGARVGLMTCYDMRFPELARGLVDAGAEIIAMPTAWVAGERKVDHFRTLVRARAIENTVYFVTAAQPGPRYCGHSMVVDPMGDVIAEADENSEATITASLTSERVAESRRVNPSLDNRRL